MGPTCTSTLECKDPSANHKLKFDVAEEGHLCTTIERGRKTHITLKNALMRCYSDALMQIKTMPMLEGSQDYGVPLFTDVGVKLA